MKWWLLTAGATVLVGLASAPVVAAQPDTSQWKCEYCPFDKGARAKYDAGAAIATDDAARFGNANGYDDQGGYVLLSGEGSYSGDAWQASWLLEDGGLASRYLEVEAGRPGNYDVSVSYRGLPYRLFDTTDTVFSQSADGLALPAGWTRSALTTGMPDLVGNLTPRDIESDRDIIEIGGRYRPDSRFRLRANYRRQAQDGVDDFAGAYFTQASILPRPIDYETNEVDLGLRYQGQRGHAELGYYGSFFQNKRTGLIWENPFTALPGAEQGALAQSPDNSFSQISIQGGYNLPRATRILASAAFGMMEQDDEVLGYTINSNITAGPLPRLRLDGQVDTTNLNLSVTSQPLPRLKVKFSYRYDERDNQTPRDSWSRVIVDSFASGNVETNLPYSFERANLAGSIDWKFRNDLTIAAGVERREFDRDFQEVAEQTEDTGWGQVRWRPNSHIELSGRAGTSLREIDRYDTAFAVDLGQNPLLRKYNLAHRFREFGELRISGSLPELPVSLSATAAFANDDYSQSVLGLLQSEQVRAGVDISWAVKTNAHLYATLGMEGTEADQAGASSFQAPNWQALHKDDFVNVGLGFQLKQIREKVDVKFDYSRGLGTTEIDVITNGSSPSRLPDLESTSDSVRLSAVYRRSEQLRWFANLRYERFDVDDWALQGVAPTTIPTVLTLGADPYHYDVIVIGLGFSYGFGNAPKTSE